MIPNRFVIKWDGHFVALDLDSDGYPFQSSNPNQINFYTSKETAQRYINILQRYDSMEKYTTMEVVEIEFRIVELK